MKRNKTLQDEKKNWKRATLYHQGSACYRGAREANPSSSDSLGTEGILMLSLVVYQSYLCCAYQSINNCFASSVLHVPLSESPYAQEKLPTQK